jgi:hypothetical protein
MMRWNGSLAALLAAVIAAVLLAGCHKDIIEPPAAVAAPMPPPPIVAPAPPPAYIEPAPPSHHHYRHHHPVRRHPVVPADHLRRHWDRPQHQPEPQQQ